MRYYMNETFCMSVVYAFGSRDVKELKCSELSMCTAEYIYGQMCSPARHNMMRHDWLIMLCRAVPACRATATAQAPHDVCMAVPCQHSEHDCPSRSHGGPSPLAPALQATATAPVTSYGDDRAQKVGDGSRRRRQWM